MLKKTKRPPGNYTKKLITSLAFMICVWGQSLQPVSAEGSRDLVKNFGYRPYTEWLPGVPIAGIPRRTLLKVYVQAGETINLGSSVHTSFGGGTQDIVYRTPSGTTGSCDVLSTGFGFIDTFAKESNGPFPAAGGYTPCTITAPAAGVYEVEFHGPSETSTANPPVREYNVQFPTDGTQEATVAAWDITVTSNGVRQPGRVFTNYLSLNMGGNSGAPNPDQLGLNSILFVQTIDGYRYRVTLDRLDPGNFIFFGNNRGFIDKTDNTNLYRSITAPTEALNFIGNVGLHLPTLADTSTDVTHRVFFNRPDSVTLGGLGGLGIPLTATLPQAPPDFKFTGIAGNTTKVNQGGRFTFTTNQFGKYQIVIDTNGNGNYGDSNDRILTGGIVSGLNTVNWDGRDQANTALPVGTYNAKVYVTAGEYHFPLLDAESNAGGLRIIMENAPGAFNNTAKDNDGRDIGNSTVYYDDSNYTTKNGTPVDLDVRDTDEIASAPRNALKGRSSSAFGRHQWSNLYGNLRGIDTWTYFLDPSGTATPIVIVADVVGTKQVKFKSDADSSGSVTINDIMEYTITYSNIGNDATNFVIKDTLPAQLTYVDIPGDSLEIVSQTPGNTLGINSSYNGTTDVNLINPGTLRVGDTITIKLRAKVNAVAANISNQAIATFIPSGSANTVTVLTDAVPTTGGVTNPTTDGQIVTQTANNGIETGNDPSKTEDDDPTLFTSVNNPPKLLLVKRITALNGTSTNFNGFDPLDATNSPTNQVSSNWPSPNTTYLRGKINGGQVEPGNILEYTIYFLSVGGVPAANTKICDLVPDGLEFVPTGFNNDTGISPNTGSDFGIVLGWDSTNTGSLPSPATPLNGTSLLRLTGVGDADGGEFFAAGTTPSTTCTAANTNGAVVVVVGVATGIPKATAPGTPTGSYGFFRFRARVK
ncbi:MAG: isopeptide-forming domain-containing fimbrial protein [Aphanizomenon flos-aquae DEX188]|nr:MAG: isopeptide-forming domain-containing fimbrial protein [Aphanizomenon flos-aquae DEX188]